MAIKLVQINKNKRSTTDIAVLIIM